MLDELGGQQLMKGFGERGCSAGRDIDRCGAVREKDGVGLRSAPSRAFRKNIPVMRGLHELLTAERIAGGNGDLGVVQIGLGFFERGAAARSKEQAAGHGKECISHKRPMVESVRILCVSVMYGVFFSVNGAKRAA